MPVKVIQNASEWRAVLEDRSTLYLVDFQAAWCNPSKAVRPLFEKLSEQYGHNATFVMVDVDEVPAAAESAAIAAMPTFQVWKGGSVVQRGETKLELVGAIPNKLEELVKTASSLAW